MKSRWCGMAVAVALLVGAVMERAPAAERLAEFTSDPISFCDLDRTHLESPEWQTAIATAKSHMSRFGGYYSVLRIVLQEPLSEHEQLRVDANKLKDLTPEYSGGGGRFRDVSHGGFVLVQHISTSRAQGADPIVLRSLYRGMATIQVPVPTRDVLQVVGDVVVHPRQASERPTPVMLDDVRRAPRQGLLGRDFRQVTMLKGRWEQSSLDASTPSRNCFVVTQIDQRPLKTPARFDTVEIVDTELRPLAAAVGQTWDLAGYEELTVIGREDSATPSPQQPGSKLVRVVLKGVRANLNP